MFLYLEYIFHAKRKKHGFIIYGKFDTSRCILKHLGISLILELFYFLNHAPFIIKPLKLLPLFSFVSISLELISINIRATGIYFVIIICEKRIWLCVLALYLANTRSDRGTSRAVDKRKSNKQIESDKHLVRERRKAR